MNFHAVSHSLPHRGPGAGRARTRWQPYASNVTLPACQRSPSVFLHTPASSTASSTPSTAHIPPVCDIERLKFSLQPQVLTSSLRDAQKTKYAAKLVDQAVKTLCETWHPDEIPSVFTIGGRDALCAQPEPKSAVDPSPTFPLTAHGAATLFPGRNTQLPSPVSPTSCQTPSPPGDRCESYSQAPDGAGSCNLVPIKGFVHEVLRRSRTSTGVLQTALCYLEAVRFKVPELLRSEKAYPTSERHAQDPPEPRIVQAVLEQSDSFGAEVPDSAISTDLPTVRVEDTVLVCDLDSDAHPVPFTVVDCKKTDAALAPLPPLPSPLCCPRRTFLACLILASKFMQDRSYSNRAWAKLAGLPPREIGRCERALGEALEWRLWVGKIPATSNSSRMVSRSRSDGDLLCGGTPRTCSQSSTAPWASSSTAGVCPSATPSKHALSSLLTPPKPSRCLQRSATVPAVGSDRSSAFLDNSSASTAQSYGLTYYYDAKTTPETGYENTFAMDVEPRVEVSPVLSTPTLSYSPMSTASSSSEGSEDRTIQMPMYTDLPTPAMSVSSSCGGSLGPWVANTLTYTPSDPANPYGSFGAYNPYSIPNLPFIDLEREGGVGSLPHFVSPMTAKQTSIQLPSFSEAFPDPNPGVLGTSLQ